MRSASPLAAMDEQATFDLIWYSILFIPALAVCAFIATRRWLPQLRIRFVLGCGVLVVSLSLLIAFRVSFASTTFNLYAIAAAYLAYCYVAVSFWRIRRPLIRIITLGIAAIPVVVGYALGTVGEMALGFAVGDYTRPPEYTELVQPGVTCRITTWGWIPSSGLTVHLYKTWAHIPFLEKEITRRVINDADPDARVFHWKMCSDVAAGHAS
jgi:hypothetical protein